MLLTGINKNPPHKCGGFFCAPERNRTVTAIAGHHA